MTWGFWLMVGGVVSVAAALFWGRIAGTQTVVSDDLTDEELAAYLEALKPSQQSPKEPT